MKTLLTINQQDIDPLSPVIDTAHFKERYAARAVLLDANGMFYLLNVGLYTYHKLPGGGVEKDEDAIVALNRELMEEVGCKAEILTELGTIVEYRDFEQLKQTSYAYLARQIGDQLPSNLEDYEIDEGFEEVKVENIDAALVLLKKDVPTSLEGKFIQRRDIAFLEEAKRILTQHA